MNDEIKKGDSVKVKYLENGPTMSVQSINDNVAKCALWSEFKQEFEYMYHNTSALEKVTYVD